MENITFFLQENISAEFLLLTAVILALCFKLCQTSNRLQKLQQRYEFLTDGSEESRLGELLTTTLQEVRTGKKECEELAAQGSLLEKQLQNCVQRVSVIRFNAFDDTGSNLSYSVALLDAKNNGVVFSSIFGRDENRCYAKPITEGKSEYALSDEELQALKKIKLQ